MLKEMMSVSAAEPRSPTRQGEDSLSSRNRLAGTMSTKEREKEKARQIEGNKRDRSGKQTVVNEIGQVRMPRSHPSLSSFISLFCCVMSAIIPCNTLTLSLLLY